MSDDMQEDIIDSAPIDLNEPDNILPIEDLNSTISDDSAFIANENIENTDTVDNKQQNDKTAILLEDVSHKTLKYNSDIDPIPLPQTNFKDIIKIVEAFDYLRELHLFRQEVLKNNNDAEFNQEIPELLKDHPAIINTYSNIDPDKYPKNITDWLGVLFGSINHISGSVKELNPNNGNILFEDALNRKDAMYNQYVEFSGKHLKASYPKFGNNKNIKGEGSIYALMSHIGKGGVFQVPLWHTGIWITFKAPTNGEILEFYRKQMTNKAVYGRNYYGLLFSGETGILVEGSVRFALDHIYNTTLKNEYNRKTKLLEIISVNDIPALLWGFICTIYSKGFPYKAPCTGSLPDMLKNATDETCNFIIEEKLNVWNLFWSDTHMLTPHQLTHMAEKSPNKKSLDEVKEYQAAFNVLISNYGSIIKPKYKVRIDTDTGGLIITTDNGAEVEFNFKIPSIQDYINSTHKNLDILQRVVEDLSKTIIEDIPDKIKNDPKLAEEYINDRKQELIENYIDQHVYLSMLREYSHYVSSIKFTDIVIDENDIIAKTLESLSGDDIVRNSFLEAVKGYIENSVISIVGLPQHNCPACHRDQSEASLEYPRLVKIIPLDVVRLFFTLTISQIQKHIRDMNE